MPLFIEKKNGKKIYINLNNYRNWHFHTSNNIKKQYQQIAIDRLPKIKCKKINLTFILYRGDNRKVDRSNVLSIHEKFFCDALTRIKFIPDDNDDYIESTTYKSGKISKDNPRVDIFIDVL